MQVGSVTQGCCLVLKVFSIIPPRPPQSAGDIARRWPQLPESVLVRTKSEQKGKGKNDFVHGPHFFIREEMFCSSAPKADPWVSLSRNRSHGKHQPQRGLEYPVQQFWPFVRGTGKEGGCWAQLSGTPRPSISATEKPLIPYFYFLSVSLCNKTKDIYQNNNSGKYIQIVPSFWGGYCLLLTFHCPYS